MKRKLLKNFIIFTICSSVFAGLFSVSEIVTFAVSEQTQEAIDETKEEKEQLQETLKEQEKEKEALEYEKTDAKQRLDVLKEQYATVTKELEDLERQTVLKEQEIAEKNLELEAMEAKHREQYAAMKMRIQYAYEQPKESFVSILLKKLPMGRLLNQIDQAVQMQEYDRNQLEMYAEMAEEISKQKQEMEAAREELGLLILNAERMQAQVAVLQERTKQSIQEYLDQIAETEEEIHNTEEAIAKKSKALKELYAKAAAEEEAERARQAAADANKLQEAINNGVVKTGDSGIVYGEVNLSQNEMDMLTAMIYCESRGESYEGQLAVGHVIMNRLRSTKYPGTLEGVLRQHLQFEPAGSGRFDIVLTAYQQNIPGVISQAEWDSCRRAAENCVNGESNVGECLFFRTHKPVPQLAENLKAAGVPYWVIGNHIFYYSWVNY